MNDLWIAWIASTVAMLGLIATAGWASSQNVLGALIDTRGRYSLTRLQFLLWLGLILPLVTGVFVARLSAHGVQPLAFTIPQEVLGVLAVAATSAAVSTAIKAHKNSTREEFIAASPPGSAALAQLFLVEEGPEGDRSIDLTKVQQFAVTVFLIGAYAATAVHTFRGWGPLPTISQPSDIVTLPGFDPTFITLLVLSHAGYLAAKVPNRGSLSGQDNPGYTLTQRRVEIAALPQTDRRGLVAARRQTAQQRAQDIREAAAASIKHQEATAQPVASADGTVTPL
jgi:hypothetical protein